MSDDSERKKFRNQFTKEQWDVLTTEADFSSAWKSNDLIRTGELYGPILYPPDPETKTKRDRRIQRELLNTFVYNSEGSTRSKEKKPH